MSIANRKFAVYKKLICSVSDFFKAAFDGEFKESHTKEIELSDTTVLAFEILLERLYMGNLPAQLLSPDPAKVICGYQYPEILPDYYTMIDKLLLPSSFRTEALDSWVRDKLTANTTCGENTLKRLVVDIPEPDPVHALVLDFAAYDYSFNGRKALLKEWFPLCSDSQRLHFVECISGHLSNYVNENIKKMDHVRAVMDMNSFTSIANMPRYQVGYLSKGKAGQYSGNNETKV